MASAVDFPDHPRVLLVFLFYFEIYLYRIFFEHIQNEIGTNKAGTAGDKIGFHKLSLQICKIPVQRFLPWAHVVANCTGQHQVIE